MQGLIVEWVLPVAEMSGARTDAEVGFFGELLCSQGNLCPLRPPWSDRLCWFETPKLLHR